MRVAVLSLHTSPIAPLGGRDYVIVFPPVDEPCDHLLAGLRLLVRQA